MQFLVKEKKRMQFFVTWSDLTDRIHAGNLCGLSLREGGAKFAASWHLST